MAGLTLDTAPASEPVTTAEAKTHARVLGSDEDTLIGTYITAARKLIEDWSGRAFINQTWDLTLDIFPGVDYIEMPKAPLSSVSSITYTDTAGDSQTLASSEYNVDTNREPGIIRLADGSSWPATDEIPNAVTIQFVAGYGATSASVDERYILAIKMLVAHWYSNREPVVKGTILTPVPLSIKSLIDSDRIFGPMESEYI